MASKTWGFPTLTLFSSSTASRHCKSFFQAVSGCVHLWSCFFSNASPISQEIDYNIYYNPILMALSVEWYYIYVIIDGIVQLDLWCCFPMAISDMIPRTPVGTCCHRTGWGRQVIFRKFYQSIKTGLKTGLSSGKRLHNYGKSPFLMGTSTINSHFQ